jgi:WD40 repeat protein
MNRALAKEREDRYPTPGELSRALKTISTQVEKAAAAKPEIPDAEPEAAAESELEAEPEPSVAERVAQILEEEAATVPPTVVPEPEAEPEIADEEGDAWITALRDTGELEEPQPARPRRIPGWIIGTVGLAVIVGAVAGLSQSGLIGSRGGEDDPSSVQTTEPEADSPVAVVGSTAMPTEVPTIVSSPTPVPSPEATATPAATSVSGWGELFVMEGHLRPATDLVWSTEGNRIASANDRVVIFWNAATGAPLIEIELDPTTNRIALSRNVVAATSGLRDVTAWSVLTGQQLFTLNTAYNDLAWSPDERRLGVSTGSTVVVYDGETGDELQRLPPTATRMSWSPDGTTLIAALTFSASHWDAVTGRALGDGQGSCRSFMIWSPNGTSIACSGATIVYPEGSPWGFVRSDNTVQLWSVEPLEESLTLTGHTAPVTSAAWSPDSQFLASVSEDLTLRIWSAGTGEQVRVFEGQAGPPAWAPDSNHLASVDTEGTLWVWEIESGEQLLSVVGAAGPVAWAPDGTRLAWAAQDGSIRIWGGG